MYMGNFYFQSLTPGHKAVLEEYSYWKHIVNKKAEGLMAQLSAGTPSELNPPKSL